MQKWWQKRLRSIGQIQNLICLPYQELEAELHEEDADAVVVNAKMNRIQDMHSECLVEQMRTLFVGGLDTTKVDFLCKLDLLFLIYFESVDNIRIA